MRKKAFPTSATAATAATTTKKKNLSDYLPHHSQVICCYQAADYLTLRRTRRAFAASAIFSQMIARLFVDVLPGWHSAEICLRGCFFASG